MNTINNVAEIKVSYYPSINNSFQIKDSKSSFELLLDGWCKNTLEMQEEVKILLLNRSNKVLGIYTLAKGGLNSCEVDIRIILSVALKTLSTGIILIHNHPSGNTKPSKADISITENENVKIGVLPLTAWDSIRKKIIDIKIDLDKVSADKLILPLKES